MVAPLVIAAIGLAKQKSDQTQANIENEWQAWSDYERERKQHEYDVQANIAARRASRAGDAGYMQSALGQSMDEPKYHPPAFVGDNGAGMRIAAGLASQYGADIDENAAKATEARGWRLPDDDLIDPWGR